METENIKKIKKPEDTEDMEVEEQINKIIINEKESENKITSDALDASPEESVENPGIDIVTETKAEVKDPESNVMRYLYYFYTLLLL